MTAGRSMLLRRRNSSWRRDNPSAVMGIFSMAATTLNRQYPAYPGELISARANGGGRLERPLKIGLERGDFKLAGLEGGDRRHRGAGAGNGGVIGNLVHERRAPDAEAVGDRLGAVGRVEDELHAAVLHGVDDMGPSLHDLPDLLDLEAVLAQEGRGAARGDQAEAELDEAAAHRHHGGLVLVPHRDEDGALERQLDAAAELGL